MCFETHEDVFLSCKQHATEVIFGFLEIKYTSASNMAIDCVRFCVVLFDNENGYTKDRKVFHVYGKCKILLTIVRYTCIFSKIDLYVDSCLVDLVHLHIGSMMLSLSCLLGLTLVQICLRTIIGTGCIYIYISSILEIRLLRKDMTTFYAMFYALSIYELAGHDRGAIFDFTLSFSKTTIRWDI